MALGTAVMVSIEAILIIAAGAATAPVPKIAASANRLDLLATAKKLSLPVCELRFLGSEPFLSLNQEALAFPRGASPSQRVPSPWAESLSPA